MNGVSFIDTTFDVRLDAGGRDPDSHSKMLRRYHRLLWSKPLPSGAAFELDDKLHHKSDLGEFWLSSDAITNTYSKWRRPARLVDVVRQIPRDEMTAFYDLGCTIGAYLVFPLAPHVDGRRILTINGARGIHPKIRDRFDLTLECIRLHYGGGESPLSATLAQYAGFFDLFGSFTGYVDHFLLNDLVTVPHASVKFLKDFKSFADDPLPAANLADYTEYMRRTIKFIRSRNARIARYGAALGAQLPAPNRRQDLSVRASVRT